MNVTFVAFSILETNLKLSHFCLWIFLSNIHFFSWRTLISLDEMVDVALTVAMVIGWHTVLLTAKFVSVTWTLGKWYDLSVVTVDRLNVFLSMKKMDMWSAVATTQLSGNNYSNKFTAFYLYSFYKMNLST